MILDQVAVAVDHAACAVEHAAHALDSQALLQAWEACHDRLQAQRRCQSLLQAEESADMGKLQRTGLTFVQMSHEIQGLMLSAATGAAGTSEHSKHAR